MLSNNDETAQPTPTAIATGAATVIAVAAKPTPAQPGDGTPGP